MRQYRAYPVKIDPRPGQPANPPHIIECDNDERAIALARKFVNGCDVELWEGARFVVALKSTDAA